MGTTSRRFAVVLAASLFATLPCEAARKEGDAVIYSPVGKRDPFRPPAVAGGDRALSALNPLERYPVDQFQLKAILRGLGAARAMLESPDGKTHIIREGDRFGRERAAVSRILDSEVIVTERTFNYLGEESLYEKVLSLPQEEVKGASIETSGAKAPAPGVALPAQLTR